MSDGKNGMKVGEWAPTEEQQAELDRRKKLTEMTVTAAIAVMEEIVRRINGGTEKLEPFELREMAAAVNQIATIKPPAVYYTMY